MAVPADTKQSAHSGFCAVQCKAICGYDVCSMTVPADTKQPAHRMALDSFICRSAKTSNAMSKLQTHKKLKKLHPFLSTAYAALFYFFLFRIMISERTSVRGLLSPGISSFSPARASKQNVQRKSRLPAIVERSLPCRKRATKRRDFGTTLELVNGGPEEYSSEAIIDNKSVRAEITPDLKWDKLRHQFAAYVEMSIPYFKESDAGRWLLAGMIGMLLLNSGVSVLFSYVGRDFWSALSSKDSEQFMQMLIKYLAALAVGAPVSVYYRYQREKLAIEWREWMTDRTFQLYTSNRVYYALERGREIDNPDQRIAEDVRSFTSFSLELIITVLTAIIDLFSFSAILYSIQPQLFGVIILYAAFGTITTTVLGQKLVALNFERLFREADFRYSLVRIRENAESIAFYAGEDIEGKETGKRLNKVIENRRGINVAQRNLEFFTTAYRYLIQVLPVSVVAPQYFAGKIELGVVSQSVGAFNHILNDLSIIVNNIESLASFSAGIDRLSQFLGAIREGDPDRTIHSPLLSLANATETSLTTVDYLELSHLVAENESSGKAQTINLRKISPLVSRKSSKVLTVTDLSLETPDRKRMLIRNLNFSLTNGEHLLIVGSSGAGKSSLLRAIAGLWTSGCGTIERLSDEDVYFLPQRPYCTLGTLKDQILYPSMDQMVPEDFPPGHRLSKAHLLRDKYTSQDLLKVLSSVGLSELPIRVGDGDPIQGLTTVIDWSNTLSLGEQQRLAFCRVLVNKPHLVICDEATSALDMEAERKMYELIKVHVPDATIVSVGHRPSLMRYHSLRLRVSPEYCELSKIDAALLKEIEGSILMDNM